MKPIDQTIAALEEKLRQAKAKKQQFDARKRAADQRKKRSEDTRRKVLVGAIVLARVERSEWPADKLREMMDKALTREDDRALFDLKPLPPPVAAPKA
jgi:uncharacterized protein involved in exopolysaccharide biosynthesis